jgi:hypothetical protein
VIGICAGGHALNHPVRAEELPVGDAAVLAASVAVENESENDSAAA